MRHGTTSAFTRFAYDLGRARATGEIIATRDAARLDRISILGGSMVTSAEDALGRLADERLTRVASIPRASFSFKRGAVCGEGRRVSLAAWAKRLAERQLDAEEARALLAEIGERRVVIPRDAVPDREILDPTDVALVGALARPSTIAELSTVARVPTFRVLAFLHFLRTVGAVSLGERARASREEAPASSRDAASGVLGVPPGASGDLVKRAFKRLARALHPDLHPYAGEAERRELERRLAQVNAAYGELIALAP